MIWVSGSPNYLWVIKKILLIKIYNKTHAKKETNKIDKDKEIHIYRDKKEKNTEIPKKDRKRERLIKKEIERERKK